MGKIIIRYWEKKVTLEGRDYSHISLETSNGYMSFYPDLLEKKESLPERGLGSIYKGKFIKKSEDLRLSEAPPTLEISLYSLNSELMDRAIAILKKQSLNWQVWGTEIKGSPFNCATLILLLLKVGGIEKIISEDKLSRLGMGSTSLGKAIYHLEITQNISAFYHFASKVQKDVNPNYVLSLARNSETTSLYDLSVAMTQFCFCCVCCGAPAIGYLLLFGFQATQKLISTNTKIICNYGNFTFSYLKLASHNFLFRKKEKSEDSQESLDSSDEKLMAHYIKIQ